MEKLTVKIEDKEYQVEKPVFDLIHSISLERDEIKKHKYNLSKKVDELTQKLIDAGLEKPAIVPKHTGA